MEIENTRLSINASSLDDLDITCLVDARIWVRMSLEAF